MPLLTPSAYCNNRLAHLNCTAIINSKGECLVHYKGKTYTLKEFDKAFPVNQFEITSKASKGLNRDTQRNLKHF